jgi:hypothetical protein
LNPALVETTGLHGLQFFDRLSLWLCCAERTQSQDFQDAAGATIRCEPVGPTEIRVHADAFIPRELRLSVPTISIPRRRYADDAELRAAIADGSRGWLSWTLVAQ